MGASDADQQLTDAVRAGYSFEGAALELGRLLLDAERLTDVPVRIPLAMRNRHGLVAGATGTGKTRTLQLLVEQLSAAGVPVFAADIKGDLSGVSQAGEGKEPFVKRAKELGIDYTPDRFPVVFWDVFGEQGHPIRATVSEMGPLLLARLLDAGRPGEALAPRQRAEDLLAGRQHVARAHAVGLCFGPRADREALDVAAADQAIDAVLDRAARHLQRLGQRRDGLARISP